MKKRRKARTLDEVQREWYGKLAKEGFEDIEDTSSPDRPLKEWHAHKFRDQRTRLRQMDRERYDKLLSDFLNSNSIDEICALIVRHGNSSISPHKVKLILEFHRGGLTERKIAKKVRCGKKCVHITLKKAKEWMKVA